LGRKKPQGEKLFFGSTGHATEKKGKGITTHRRGVFPRWQRKEGGEKDELNDQQFKAGADTKDWNRGKRFFSPLTGNFLHEKRRKEWGGVDTKRGAEVTSTPSRTINPTKECDQTEH